VRALSALVCSAALVLSAAAVPDPAVGHPSSPPGPTAERKTARGDDLGYYDVRRSAGVPAARRSVRGGGLLEIDPATGTVRVLEKLDGYLTGPSGRSARSVALGYVRQHLTSLGLTTGDLRTFRFHRESRHRGRSPGRRRGVGATRPG
jgi:extracellular elastinolytic metalloproteinase